MESGGSGIAATQSHHQGRASKHEHGDASHVQQHGAHAAGRRQRGAPGVCNLDRNGTRAGFARSFSTIIHGNSNVGQSGRRSLIIPLLTVLSGCNDLDSETIFRQVVACRSLGFLQRVGAIVQTDDGEIAMIVRLDCGAAVFIQPVTLWLVSI